MSETVDYRAALAARVRVLRKDQGMSQTQLEDVAGLERPWVSRLENEHHSLDDLEKLTRLAKGLGLSLGGLLWPVLADKSDIAQAEAAARESFEQERHALHEAWRREYLAALTSAEAAEILAAIAQFIAQGKPEIVQFVAGMIGRGGRLAMAEKFLEGFERLPDRQPRPAGR